MADRAEATGLGVAVGGHVLLLGALSLGLLATQKPMPPLTQPVDITLVDEVALRDATPTPSTEAPAASVAPELGPPVSEPVAPPPVAQPTPLPKVQQMPAPVPAPTRPTPKPVVRPAPAPPVTAKSSPKPVAPPTAKPVPARPRLALNLAPGTTAPRGARLGSDFLKGVADRPSAATAPAARTPAGPAVEASLVREITRQLKPFWKAPTGADAEQLRTELRIALGRDGSVTEVRVLRTTGQTDSNRGQVRLHQEAAIKAVRLAAPFVLPAELYDAWRVLEPVGFDKRLGS